MSLRTGTVRPALSLIWHRWNGLKHVWEPSNGWPFQPKPELNDEIALSARAVISIERKNYLRRYVSGVISKQLAFWVGTQQEFRARLETIQLREIDREKVKTDIAVERTAFAALKTQLDLHSVPALHLVYEDLLGEDTNMLRQLEVMENVWEFLGVRKMTAAEFQEKCVQLLERDNYKWASPDVYRMIPEVDELEREVGCDETGWLFKGSG